MKNKTMLLRIDEEFEHLINIKSNLLKTDKSKLIRESVYGYWEDRKYDPKTLFETYQNNPDLRPHIIKLIAKFLRKNGYPYNHLNKIQLQNEMNKLQKTKSPLLENNILQLNTVGLVIANHFHHEMYKVKYNRYKSPWEQFADDSLLEDTVNRVFELNRLPTFTNIRKMLKTRDGVKSAVNFKPVLAKYFYDNYCPDNGIVLDPCAGFGGRLTGCISSNKGISYIGIEPHGKTYIGNARLASCYALEWKFKYSAILGCAEDVMRDLVSNSYDLVFTSPPFFDTERYSQDKNQSYIRYPEYGQWRDGFLRPLIENAFRLLKDGGYFILNIKNYKNRLIADDSNVIADGCKFKLIKTYQIKMANLEYGLKQEKKWHSEPVFVWQK